MLELETEKLEEKLYELRDVLTARGESSDMGTILRDEAGRIMIMMAQFTPPYGPGGKAQGARQAGENAVKKELRNLISEAKPTLLQSIEAKYGDTNVQTYRETSSHDRLLIKFGHINRDGSQLESLHNLYRSRRGKVPMVRSRPGEWNARIVVEEGKREPFIKKEVAKVGRWKASILIGLPYLGTAKHVPNWISRHFGSVRDIAILNLSQINDPQKPSLEFGTRAPGTSEPAYNYRAKLQEVVTKRTKAIASRIRLLIRLHSEGISNGEHPKSHAVESSTESAPILE